LFTYQDALVLRNITCAKHEFIAVLVFFCFRHLQRMRVVAHVYWLLR